MKCWIGFLFFLSLSPVSADVVQVPLFDLHIEKKPIPAPKERAAGKIAVSLSFYEPRNLVLSTRSGQTASKFQRKDLPMLQFQSHFQPWEFSDSRTALSPVVGFSFLRLERSGVLSESAIGLRTEQNAVFFGALVGAELRKEWVQNSQFNTFFRFGLQPSWVFAQRTAISSEQNHIVFPLFSSIGVGIPVFYKTELVLAVESLFLSQSAEVNVNGWGMVGGVQFRL